MYKLLIVDDEETIREGLSNVVDWKSLGFEVLQAVEDGEDAVKFIDKNAVDVILTDVKMTFMSGIELARYVQQNKPQIKVVIISGHRDFEFARQAMSCNVTQYILKPIRLDELKRVFTDIKAELDREILQREKIKKESQLHKELLMMNQEQFFTDLIMGALLNKEDIDKRIKKIGLDINPALCKICVVNLGLSQAESHDTAGGDAENESLYTTLRNYVTGVIGEVQYYTIYNNAKNLKVLSVAPAAMDDGMFEKAVKQHIDNISAKIKVIIGMNIHSEIERTFGSMYETAIHFKPVKTPTGSETLKIEEVISKIDYSHLMKQQKLLISYVKSDNPQLAENLFENIMGELKLVDKRIVQNWIVSLFAVLRNDLSELGIHTNNCRIDYEDIFKLHDDKALAQWGYETIEKISQHVKRYQYASEKKVIQKAKEYIKANYAKNIGLEEVADSVYLNSIYFSRRFKQETNENFVDYLVKVRMRKAKELLQDHSLKVYEVSERVGYKNTKYFYRLFKEYTGLTPAEYRETCAETGVDNEKK